MRGRVHAHSLQLSSEGTARAGPRRNGDSFVVASVTLTPSPCSLLASPSRLTGGRTPDSARAGISIPTRAAGPTGNQPARHDVYGLIHKGLRSFIPLYLVAFALAATRVLQRG